MTLDPRVGFWLSIVLAVIGALAGASTQFTTMFGEHTANIVLACCITLLSVGNAINAILHAIPSAPGQAKDFALGPTTPKAVVAFFLVAGALLMLGNPAHAQPSAKVSKSAATTNPLLALRTFTVADLQAALADAQAQTPPDTTAADCYTALIPIVQSGAANPLPKGLGGFQLLQKGRDLKAAVANLQSPNGPLASLNKACAPLIIDTQNTLIQLGIIGGGIAATSGITLPFGIP